LIYHCCVLTSENSTSTIAVERAGDGEGKNTFSFSDFITWEQVQEEIWYNEKGLSEKGIAEIWEKIAGCVSREVSKETFVLIYQSVCDITYEL
jgi:hypothetical protein